MDLQNIINQQASSGKIQLPAGLFTPANDVFIPNDVVLQGVGPKTKIKLQPGRSLISENGYNVTLRDFLLDGSVQEIDNKALIVKNPHDVTVDHLWVTDCVGFGVFPVSDETFSGKFRVINSRLSGKGNNDVLGGGPNIANSNMIDFIIHSNFIRQSVNTTNTYRAALDIVSLQNAIIQNNILEGNLIMGGEKIPHMNVIMSRNIVRPAMGCTEAQVSVLTSSNAGESDSSFDLSIEYNHVIGGHIFVQGQSQTSSRTQCSIIGNTIRGLKTTSNPQADYHHAISANYTKYAIIAGNKIWNAATALYLNDARDTYVGTNYFFGCDTERELLNGTNCL